MIHNLALAEGEICLGHIAQRSSSFRGLRHRDNSNIENG